MIFKELLALEQFEAKWDTKFPSTGRSWCNHWHNVSTLFLYPEAIRKAIKNRKIFGHDNSAFKIVFWTIELASKKWTMPIRDWNSAMNQFTPLKGVLKRVILHEERLKDYL